MNHDYSHCADYNDDCPTECFRGELVRDYRERKLSVPVSWAHFKNTIECEMQKEKNGLWEFAKGVHVAGMMPKATGSWRCPACKNCFPVPTCFCPNCGRKMM